MKVSLEKFSKHYRDILANAINLAMEQNSKEVLPEHLFISLLEHNGGLAQSALKDSNTVTPTATTIKPNAGLEFSPILNEETILLIDQSARFAQENNNEYIGTEHLLFAFVQSCDSSIQLLLKNSGISKDKVEKELLEIFDETKKLQSLLDETKEDTELDIWSSQPPSALEAFTYELTDSEQTELDPIVGRSQEIYRATEILLRKSKNNPLLVGQPGVGKTAIVEGLAHSILQGTCPAHLRDKKIFALDVNALVAGTMYRGEFEARLKELLSEISERDDVILFIDEIHTIVGAGSSHGSMDIANILKPSLARGEIRCIGATTYAEYKKYIKQDAALERRFQTVHVSEPTKQETLHILQGIKNHYEEFHGVTIDMSALKSAVEFTVAHIPHRQLPDKAIDVIDEACSMIKMKTGSATTIQQLQSIKKKIGVLEKEKDSALFSEKIAKAHSLAQEIETLDNKRKTLEEKRTQKASLPKRTVTQKHVAQIVARHCNVSVAQLLQQEKTKLVNFSKALQEEIKGQNEVLSIITSHVQRARLGLVDSHRPKSSMIFVGPSGVGKTQTAKVLAQQLFHSPDALIKVDMSEYSERHSIAKLTGAPAGYVGYKDDTPLIAQLRKRPASVIVFDEIEKAHPDIFNIFLQILDDGFLTDSTGEKISFEQSYIIFTSNLGSTSSETIGFDTNTQDKYQKELKQFLRPEVLHRIDATVTFSPLTHEALCDISERSCAIFKEKIAQHKVQVSIPKSVSSWIASQAKDVGGARTVSSLVKKHIEDPVISQMLKGKQKLSCKLHDNSVSITHG